MVRNLKKHFCSAWCAFKRKTRHQLSIPESKCMKGLRVETLAASLLSWPPRFFVLWGTTSRVKRNPGSALAKRLGKWKSCYRHWIEKPLYIQRFMPAEGWFASWFPNLPMKLQNLPMKLKQWWLIARMRMRPLKQWKNGSARQRATIQKVPRWPLPCIDAIGGS